MNIYDRRWVMTNVRYVWERRKRVVWPGQSAMGALQVKSQKGKCGKLGKMPHIGYLTSLLSKVGHFWEWRQMSGHTGTRWHGLKQARTCAHLKDLGFYLNWHVKSWLGSLLLAKSSAAHIRQKFVYLYMKSCVRECTRLPLLQVAACWKLPKCLWRTEEMWNFWCVHEMEPSSDREQIITTCNNMDKSQTGNIWAKHPVTKKHNV